MQRKETLVLLVADYPNPSGEPFLEDELKVISSDFSQIYILQTNSSEFFEKSRRGSRPLPLHRIIKR